MACSSLTEMRCKVEVACSVQTFVGDGMPLSDEEPFTCSVQLIFLLTVAKCLLQRLFKDLFWNRWSVRFVILGRVLSALEVVGNGKSVRHVSLAGLEAEFWDLEKLKVVVGRRGICAVNR